MTIHGRDDPQHEAAASFQTQGGDEVNVRQGRRGRRDPQRRPTRGHVQGIDPRPWHVVRHPRERPYPRTAVPDEGSSKGSPEEGPSQANKGLAERAVACRRGRTSWVALIPLHTPRCQHCRVACVGGRGQPNDGAMLCRRAARRRAIADVVGRGEDAVDAAARPLRVIVLEVVLPGSTCRGLPSPCAVTASHSGRSGWHATRRGSDSGLDGGRLDYLTKPFAFGECRRLRALARRDGRAGTTLGGRQLRLDPARREVGADPQGSTAPQNREFALRVLHEAPRPKRSRALQARSRHGTTLRTDRTCSDVYGRDLRERRSTGL